MTALPVNPFRFPQPRTPAYERVVIAEQSAITAQSRTAATQLPKSSESKNLVHARVVGHLLLHAPDSQSLVTEILNENAQENKDIYNIGEKYMNYFILPFKKTRAKKTPSPTEVPTPDYKQKLIEARVDGFVPAPTSHSTAKFQALARDNYQCIVTGAWDRPTLKIDRERLKTVTDNGKKEIVSLQTECAHILPSSLNVKTKDAEKILHAAKVWEVIRMVGGLNDDKVMKSLSGAGIHQLGNVMTLNPEFHTPFDLLEVWLDPVPGQRNTYDICAQDDFMLPFVQFPSRRITFTTTTKHALPNPDFLKIHSAAARVHHLCGAVEIYEDDYDLDDEAPVSPLRTMEDHGSEQKLFRALEAVAELRSGQNSMYEQRSNVTACTIRT